MSEVTRILSRIDQGDPQVAEQLLPLVYEELRKLAAAKLNQEKSSHTLQATALVHEAYLRLVDADKPQSWDSRGHFFAAAAEAMRRILIESARRKLQVRRGSGKARIDLDEAEVANRVTPDQLLAVDDALAVLESQDVGAGRVFKLRYFTGCSIEEAADLLGISRATAYRHWNFARAWLLSQLGPSA